MLNQIKEKNKDNNKLEELGYILKNKNTKNEISFIFKNENDYNNEIKLFNENSNVKRNDVEIFINGVKKELNYSGKIYLPFKGLYYVKLIFNKEIKNCEGLFNGCDFLFIDLSFFDTKNVTNMKNMFSYCKNLVNVDLSSLNTQNVTNMESMFYYCQNLVNVDLSFLNTQNVI